MPLAVVAVGGNAMVRLHATGPEPGSARADDQPDDETLGAAAATVARLVTAGWDVVLTHGNGPQVGELLAVLEAASLGEPPPLDVLDAHTQGWLGYLLQKAVANALLARGETRAVATILTTVLVDAQDRGFQAPSKPVGPAYSDAQAEELRTRHRWRLVQESGRGWRRVVASPEPREVLEWPVIRALLRAGAVVVAGGGGGIPVVRRADGSHAGVEAVIDKDRTSALLARLLEADVLLLLTGVPEVRLDFGRPSERSLPRLTVSEARMLLRAGQFPPGSMGPKVEAAAWFAEQTGRPALITSAERALEALRGEAGTSVVNPGFGDGSSSST